MNRIDSYAELIIRVANVQPDRRSVTALVEHAHQRALGRLRRRRVWSTSVMWTTTVKRAMIEHAADDAPPSRRRGSRLRRGARRRS
jgi:hypothetical protein